MNLSCRRNSPQHPTPGFESSRPIPAWQIERANRLHRKFISVENSLAAGKTFKQATKMFVWYWRGRSYRCDRSRLARFSLVSLHHLFLKWKREGRTPSALRLKFRGLAPSVPAGLLVGFVEFACRVQFPHMREAWQSFNQRRRARRGWHPRPAPEVSYGKLQYFFTGKKFARLQSAQRGITRANRHLAELRLQYIAEIQQRLPSCPRRPRRTAEAISLESSGL